MASSRMADDVINEELAAAPPAAVHAAIDDVIGEELAAAPPPLDAVHDAIDHVMDEELRRRRRGSRFVRGTPHVHLVGSAVLLAKFPRS